MTTCREMVRKIRLRGHVIRFHEVPPGTSSSKAHHCDTCGNVYDNGSYRKCIYLCCQLEACFHCVLNKNTFWCKIIDTRRPKEKLVNSDAETEPESSYATDAITEQATSEMGSDTNMQPESSSDSSNLPAVAITEEIESEKEFHTEINPKSNEECLELPELLDELTQENFNSHTDMTAQSDSIDATMKSSTEEQNTEEVDSGKNLTSLLSPEIRIYQRKFAAFLAGAFEEHFRHSGNSNLTNLELAAEHFGKPVQDWIPYIPLDNIGFRTSDSRDASIVQEDEMGVSRLRNGKVFASNQ